MCDDCRSGLTVQAEFRVKDGVLFNDKFLSAAGFYLREDCQVKRIPASSEKDEVVFLMQFPSFFIAVRLNVLVLKKRFEYCSSLNSLHVDLGVLPLLRPWSQTAVFCVGGMIYVEKTL